MKGEYKKVEEKGAGGYPGPDRLTPNQAFTGAAYIMVPTETLNLILKQLREINGKLAGTQASEYQESWLTGEEVAQLLSVSMRTIHNYVNRGLLGVSQLGRKGLYYRRSEVEELLSKNYYKMKT